MRRQERRDAADDARRPRQTIRAGRRAGDCDLRSRRGQHVATHAGIGDRTIRAPDRHTRHRRPSHARGRWHDDGLRGRSRPNFSIPLLIMPLVNSVGEVLYVRAQRVNAAADVTPLLSGQVLEALKVIPKNIKAVDVGAARCRDATTLRRRVRLDRMHRGRVATRSGDADARGCLRGARQKGRSLPDIVSMQRL